MPRSIVTAAGAVVAQKQTSIPKFSQNSSITKAMLTNEVIGYLVPPGTALNYRGGIVPSGYLLEDGSLLSQASYPALYSAIGGTYNVGGEAAGTFRLPDSRGKTDIGAGTYTDPVSGIITRTLGASLGAERHTLALAELPAHNHGGGNHDHPNTHRTPQATTGPTGTGLTLQTGSALQSAGASGTIIGTEGSGATHNNMQPSLVATKMIKY